MRSGLIGMLDMGGSPIQRNHRTNASPLLETVLKHTKDPSGTLARRVFIPPIYQLTNYHPTPPSRSR